MVFWDAMSNLDLRPKLRALDIKRVQQRGREYLHLRDPMALSGEELLVPVHLIPLLALSDGQRDLGSIRTAAMLLHGLSITQEQVDTFFGRLDEALLLEGPRFEEARARVLETYRGLPYRTPALAGPSYPADPVALEKKLDGYMEEVGERPLHTAGTPTQRPHSVRSTLRQAQGERNEAAHLPGTEGSVVGVLSPHIDYHRGHRSYAKTWRHVSEAAAECELAIILGTDHAGGDCKITPTLQSYATPWGPLPTDKELAKSLAAGLGGESAFEEEEHHIKEHSIELALVWLHYLVRKGNPKGRVPYVLPVLCGHMGRYVHGGGVAGGEAAFDFVVSELRGVMESRKTLVIAAGDLAHVGPVFGDHAPWGRSERAALKRADDLSLEAACNGDAEGFLEGVRSEKDQRRICGLTPIYLTLRALGEEASGKVTAYDQCPADSMGGSLVSVAGVIWQN